MNIITYQPFGRFAFESDGFDHRGVMGEADSGLQERQGYQTRVSILGLDILCGAGLGHRADDFHGLAPVVRSGGLDHR